MTTYLCRSFAFIGLVIAAAGCSDKVVEQVQQTATQVKESVTNSVDSAQTGMKEQLKMVGSSEMTMDGTPAGAVKTPSCYAVFTPATGERGSVLLLQSYRAAEKEAFPSFYVHAAVTGSSLAELVGQTVPAQMFVKPTAEGPTWYTTPAASVQLKITAFENQQVTAEIVGGTLARTDGSTTTNATGKFIAVLP
jgi:hypothetical protein